MIAGRQEAMRAVLRFAKPSVLRRAKHSFRDVTSGPIMAASQSAADLVDHAITEVASLEKSLFCTTNCCVYVCSMLMHCVGSVCLLSLGADRVQKRTKGARQGEAKLLLASSTTSHVFVNTRWLKYLLCVGA